MHKINGKTSRIGVLGGIFDPIHFGHLLAAEGARCRFDLDKVYFVPSARPPHKKNQHFAGVEDRLRMTMLAISGNPYFEVSDVEMRRAGLSYSVDTVEYFRRALPESNIFFITGTDAVSEIATWHRVRELLGMCFFIAAHRPGFILEDFKESLAGLPPELVSKILLVEVPSLNVSSTHIRRLVAEHMSIKYLMPEKVERYIYEKGLYICKETEVSGQKSE